jgi:hypothetical protein
MTHSPLRRWAATGAGSIRKVLLVRRDRLRDMGEDRRGQGFSTLGRRAVECTRTPCSDCIVCVGGDCKGGTNMMLAQ